MEKTRDQPTPTESKTRLVEQINVCLRSGDYSRALELLRGAAAEFPNDAELSELEKLAQDGVKRNAEASRLITESQELFAQRKSAEAIQLLRKAHELDKNNALARAILANALVEHAHSIVETDWREAETLAKQALDLNPAHPTAKTIRSLILDRKKASPVEEWVAQASKLQSSGDLFAALSWVEEGMDIHPNNPKLLQVQDAIQRDQNPRRRQARRRDLEDLRRMELEIDAAADDAAKKHSPIAYKGWPPTIGPMEKSYPSPMLFCTGWDWFPRRVQCFAARKGAVIFHVPPRSLPSLRAPMAAKFRQADLRRTQLPLETFRTGSRQSIAEPQCCIEPCPVGQSFGERSLPSTVAPAVGRNAKSRPLCQSRSIAPPPAAATPAIEPSAPAAKVASPSSQPKQLARSNSTTLILVSSAAIVILRRSDVLLRAKTSTLRQ